MIVRWLDWDLLCCSSRLKPALCCAPRVMQLQRQSDREDLTRLVAEGKHVTILGSSWNAIELANHLR